ncbi:outer membrane beta-barrel protein [Flavobacterium sp. ZT3R18]|uniref:outer membrane beta-barrel protein n=1 Tax=Flavobacterium sp. ZT3R18 TaxID=2594429 RepID=UPI00163D3F69|nr:outer membrane beta-barrel protein [Flavobacterium sp. ZT3R18]
MKKFLVAFILGISFIGNAQDITDWQVGFNLNPFFFTRINPGSSFSKDRQDLPNGFGYGITIEKNWNDQWGVKTGFEYSKQNEKYFFDAIGDNTSIKTNFEYYKMPITIQYYYPLNDKLFLTFNQGIQFSFLKYYKTVDENEYQIRTQTSDYYEYISFEHPESNQYSKEEGIMHKKTLFGIIGSIGLKGFLSEKISYSTSLRYEYDFTTADNFPYYSSIPDGSDTEKPTHNFRLGLELGLQYHFSINDRFNKNSHKL